MLSLIQLIESSKQPQADGHFYDPHFPDEESRHTGRSRQSRSPQGGAGARPILPRRKQAPYGRWGMEWTGRVGDTGGRKGQVIRGTAAGAPSFPSAYINTHTSPNLESVSHAGGKEGRRLSQCGNGRRGREKPRAHTHSHRKNSHIGTSIAPTVRRTLFSVLPMF